jgi:hypothetical protein
MALVALTVIDHGEVKDGKNVRTVVEAGEPIAKYKFDKELVAEWLAQGTVGEPPKSAVERDEELEALQARVAELEAQLAEPEKEPAK